MQIDWLNSFLAVVDHGGFHAASEATYRAQSRISAHVANLEREVGAALLDRSARPVQLTDAGHAFIGPARQALDALREGKAAISAIRGLVRGEVTLGTYPSAGAALVPRLLREYAEAWPGVEVRLYETATAALDDLVDKATVDLALRPALPEPSQPDFDHRLLWRERIVAVHHPDHSLAAGDGDLPLTALADQPLILTGRVFQFDSEPYVLLTRAGMNPRVAHVTNEPQTLIGLVREGLGVAVTNELAVRTCDHRGVRIRRIADQALHRDVGVFWRETMTWSSAARALFDLLLITALPDGTQDLRP